MDRDFDIGILKNLAHRPWRMPESPWVMTQTWRDLLFAHWPVDPERLRTKVPSEFSLDLFEGDAWVGVVPFRMTNVAPRGMPSLPGVSEFLELNVRTYVRVGDKPGVYFFSLDAGNALAVRAARVLFNLPYFKARMGATLVGDEFQYTSRREPAGPEFVGSYGPIDRTFEPLGGSLEYFLTERYCLYNIDRRGHPYRMDIHHPPWQLQHARAEVLGNTMADASGIILPDRPPLLHFSTRQDVVAWAPVKLR